MTPLLAQRLRTDRSFERMYRRHVGDVYRYALAVLRNPADAEDVAQTTFMNAYRAFQRGERPDNAQNWLIAIAHNVCRQRFRLSARRPAEVAYDDGILDVVPDEDPGPSAEDIQRALGQLAFNQRAALVMRELEGRSYAEIAEILDITVSAVETLIFRARRALREQLEGSLTCGEAERAISRQLDGRLSRQDRAALRAHLRACKECEGFARSQRAQRTAIKALALVPVPTSLTSLFGGGTAAGGAVAIKAAAVVAAGTVAAGVGYEGVKRTDLFVPPAASPVAAVAEEQARAPVAAERSPSAGRAVTPAAPDGELAVRKDRARKASKKPALAGPPEHAVARGQDKPANAAKPSHGRPAGKAVPPGHAKAAAKPDPKPAAKAKPAARAKPAKKPKPGKQDDPPPAPVVPNLLDTATQVLPGVGV
jgi:RNA polymerase sigma factor (sigma-70 family)